MQIKQPGRVLVDGGQDIKPLNVMETRVGGQHLWKLIDFGTVLATSDADVSLTMVVRRGDDDAPARGAPPPHAPTLHRKH